MEEKTLNLSSGLIFGYYDSGAPQGAIYKTIFALHGLMFNSYVWKKMMPLAFTQNLRLVCLNRRGYGNTTPLPQDQYPAPDKDSAGVLKSIGLDILEFIHTFSQKEQLPLSGEGGFARLTWSLGTMTGLSAVANIVHASEEVKTTMSHLKALVLHEPPQVALGPPHPKGFFYPDVVQLLPPEEHQSFFHWWISGYFDHDPKALAAKSISTSGLTYASPSPFSPPSLYGVSEKGEGERLFQECGGVAMDFAFMIHSNQELVHENYKKAVFESELEEKTIFVVSDRTPEQLLIASWQAEEDGMKAVQLKGANHFSQWDFPEETMKAYLTVM